MSKNSELCASTQSKAIVTYLWRRYSIYAWIYAIMFIFFTMNTYIGLIWCTDVDKCEKFLKAGDATYSLMIINRVIMYSFYAFIVMLEFLVAINLGIGYIFNFNNFLDTFIIVFYPIVTIFAFTDVIDDNKMLPNNFFTGYLFLLGFRALLLLKVIDSVRYLIAMIINVFTDVIPFLIILVSAIFILACLEVNTAKSVTGADF